MAIHPCPVCGQIVTTNKLMCLADWKLVPLHLQLLVNLAWDAFRKAGNPRMQLAALRRHREAADAAIAAVRARIAAREAAGG